VWPIDSFSPLWDVRGDAIHAPGIFDMKCGFLQGVYAIKNLANKSEFANIAEKVAIIATSDEETGSFTTRELIKSTSAHAKAVLILESALDGKVKTARKGTAMYTVAVHGRAAHAGLEPEKGINASVELAHLIIAIEKLSNTAKTTTVVPTVISGGSTTNTVPALAKVEIDARSFSQDELVRIDKQIRELTCINPAARIEITGGINRPPLEPASSEVIFEILKSSTSKRSLPSVEGVAVGGASDGNFAAAAGAHVIDGIGAVGAGAHAQNEHILVSEIQPRITLIEGFLEDLVAALPTLKNMKK
jgi:glutamate carboxypeptidase